MKMLKELRLARGITQAQAARDLGIPRQSMSHYEAGNRQPDYDTLKLLARYYNVTVDYLISGENIPDALPGDLAEYQEKKKTLNDLFAKMTPEERELLLAVAAKMKH